MLQHQHRFRAAVRRHLWWLKETKPELERWKFEIQRRTNRWRPAKGGPNVVLVSVDSMSAKHLHCYGYHRSTSSNLDRLAERGVLFERVVAQTNWTKPALASLLTSVHCSVHKADFVTDTGDRTDEEARLQANILDGRFRTIAQEFKDAGYATAGLSDGGYAHSFFGFNRGFDLYDDHGGGLKSCGYRLLQWILKNPEVPFFGFIHCWDIHFPYLDRPPYNRMFVKSRTPIVLDSSTRLQVNRHQRAISEQEVEFLEGLFDGAISYVDQQLGVLLKQFERLGLAGNTIFAITADHGEAFMEHGALEHTECLYNEVLQVPLILLGPGLNAGSRIRAQARSVDIMPTLLDLCGLAPKGRVQGTSLSPWIRGERTDDLIAGSETKRAGGQKAITDGRYKLIYKEAGDQVEIYDLLEDPKETKDLSLTNPQLRARMQTKLRSWEANVLACANEYWLDDQIQENIDVAPEVTERLRALGYVD